MQTTVTFGEIMLRLAPPGFERFLQTPQFLATFGGGEANVAVALASFGLPAAYVTVLPADNPIADAAIGELRRFGVDTSRIVRGKGRMGIYFLETGANQRASKVVYDRDGSAIALAKPGDIDWDARARRRRLVPHHRHHAGHQRHRPPRWRSKPSGGARERASRFPAISTIARTCGNGESPPWR